MVNPEGSTSYFTYQIANPWRLKGGDCLAQQKGKTTDMRHQGLEVKSAGSFKTIPRYKFSAYIQDTQHRGKPSIKEILHGTGRKDHILQLGKWY